MKTILKIAVIAISLVFLLMADLSILSVPLVPDADAIFGVRRRMFRRGVIIGESAGAAAASQTAAMSHQQAAPAAPPAPPPAISGKPLPLGTVVAALPAGWIPHRSEAWSTTTVAVTSITQCFRGTSWCM